MDTQYRVNRLILVSELALIRAIPDLLTSDLKPGRLKNQYKRLQKEADKTLSQVTITPNEHILVGDMIGLFRERSGWGKGVRNVGTIISFALAMIEESSSEFSHKLTETLNNIVEYYENKKQFSALCYSAGAVAALKWEKIKTEQFEVKD